MVYVRVNLYVCFMTEFRYICVLCQSYAIYTFYARVKLYTYIYILCLSSTKWVFYARVSYMCVLCLFGYICVFYVCLLFCLAIYMCFLLVWTDAAGLDQWRTGGRPDHRQGHWGGLIWWTDSPEADRWEPPTPANQITVKLFISVC